MSVCEPNGAVNNQSVNSQKMVCDLRKFNIVKILQVTSYFFTKTCMHILLCVFEMYGKFQLVRIGKLLHTKKIFDHFYQFL